jgi:hypothetical protein
MEWAEKGVRKEDYVRPHLRRLERRNQFGVYFILKSMELGPYFRSAVPKFPVGRRSVRWVTVPTEVVKVPCAQAPLELLDDGPHPRGRLMGTGNIDGLAVMLIHETHRARGALQIAEDLARHGIILMGAESQVVRVGYPSFD